MLYRLLAKLFDHNEFQGEERVRHSHLIYSLLTMATGSSLWFYKGLELLGTLIIILGFGMGVSMLFCINWDKVILYWMTINEHVTLMTKNNNPDLWVALGYSAPLQKVEVIEKEDKGQGSFSWKISQVPISPAQMNLVANKLLGSGSTDFPEKEYGRLIPNFRKFRQDWISTGKLVPKNKKNPKNGYCLSRKGLMIINEFASEHMKIKEGE